MHYRAYLWISFLFMLGSGQLLATPHCEVEIHSDDQIRWDTATIEVSQQCELFTIRLIHDGKLSKDIMGHNWLLTKTQDREAIIKAMVFAKETDYIKDDPRIVAHSELIGGGEQTSVTLDVKKLVAGQAYSYFCSYPEHSELMQGTLKLEEDTPPAI